MTFHYILFILNLKNVRVNNSIMSAKGYRRLIPSEEEMDSEIFNLVKNYCEGEIPKLKNYANKKSQKDKKYSNGYLLERSLEKSFETSCSEDEIICDFNFIGKFKLSSILKVNVILGARKLKIGLMKVLLSEIQKELIMHQHFLICSQNEFLENPKFFEN